jgi:Xylose isomerase
VTFVAPTSCWYQRLEVHALAAFLQLELFRVSDWLFAASLNMEFSMQTYFDQLDRVRYEGPKSTNPLAFRHYNPDELVLGKRMEDHLRFAACYWHTFCWNGADMFGVGSFDRPWQQPGDALEMAKRKADVAFEFFHKLNVPYYCFHDVDVSPEGASLQEYSNNFARMVEVLAEKQQQSGVKLLWGTANCFTNPRYGAGAATNPDPEVFSWAATQVVTAMNATHQLGGENYVCGAVARAMKPC